MFTPTGSRENSARRVGCLSAFVESTVYKWDMTNAPVAVVAKQFPILTETVCRSVEMRLLAQHYKALSEEERAQARELRFRLRLDRAYWKAVN